MGSNRVKVSILGSGNIGTDLMYKVKRSPFLELELIAGIDPKSEGLALAKKEGFSTTAEGIKDVLNNSEVKIVFDATSAKAHLSHAEPLEKAGKIAVDLTPAAVGPYVIPAVNLEQHLDSRNVNLITCGGQATIPIVAAIKRIVNVQYAETISTIASKSAGPGTRANIDEFTQTTMSGVMNIGGAPQGKSMIILNPAEPSIMMRNTIYTIVDEPREEEITRSVKSMVEKIKSYVPGYNLKVPPLVEKKKIVSPILPIIDGFKIITMIEVEGLGDYLPKYAGNLDIQTCAAVAVAERFAQKILAERRN